MNVLNKLIDTLEKSGNNLQPCTMSEVRSLEGHYNVSLPLVYQEFLLAMGKGAGMYMRGSSAFFDEIFDLRSWAVDLVKDNKLERLPPDSFVFWMHQGYQAAFFIIDGNDNPKVYYFSEGKGQREFVIVENCLSDFFYSQLMLTNDKQ